MGAVDDAEDDDAPHFHFLKKAGIEAADSGKIRAVLAECWRALSNVNISDGKSWMIVQYICCCVAVV